MLRREETHHPSQDAATSPRVFGLKLFHARVVLPHLSRFSLGSQMSLYRSFVVLSPKPIGLYCFVNLILRGISVIFQSTAYTVLVTALGIPYRPPQRSKATTSQRVIPRCRITPQWCMQAIRLTRQTSKPELVG